MAGSRNKTLDSPKTDPLTDERIRSVIRYVKQHYTENITLQNAASYAGISREYFCRIFKWNAFGSNDHVLLAAEYFPAYGQKPRIKHNTIYSG